MYAFNDRSVLLLNSVASQCSVDGDLSSLNVIAQALLKVQMLYGVIPNIRSKGHCSKKVSALMKCGIIVTAGTFMHLLSV